MLHKVRVILVPDVLHECEMWPLALREEYKTYVFENKMLNKIITL
jgi:hypothetical protein